MRVTGSDLVPQSIFNELDQLGLLLGEPRLHGERNAAYRTRLLDVFGHRANSTYLGLMHAITRDLGLKIVDAVQIDYVLDGSEFSASSPAVVFSESQLYLYENYSTKILDLQIDRWEQDQGAYTIQQLVDKINESTYFTATLLDSDMAHERAASVLNQISHKVVSGEFISPSTIFELEHGNIMPGSLFLSDRVIFSAEVDEEEDVEEAGQYFVDYKKGVVTTYSTPLSGTTARYQYLQNPMICRASPVIIHNMQSRDFLVKIFQQVAQDNGQIVDGLPTGLGVSLINELLTVHPGTWGV